MIDNVTVLNLPHRIDRKNFMIGHLETVGVPLHIINFFPAKYGKDYENKESIREAMVADGFDFMKHEPMYQPNLAVWCYYWNWLVMLRKLMDVQRTGMIILDDRLLTIDWDTLSETVAFLCRTYPPFRILQLGWVSLWKGERKRIEPLSGLVARGIRSNGDYATVLSADGAKQLFDLLRSGIKSTEPLFFRLSQPDINPTGLFHMIKSQTKSTSMAWKEDIYGD